MSHHSASETRTGGLGNRIIAIDALRGLVMLLMLVDHVRERFFYHHAITDPMTLADTSTSLFFTRMTAHLCAPVFVFLTGLSAWLYANPVNRPTRSAQSFLLKRGLFIILIEVTLINFSWFGDYKALYLQVMWAIGISMITLALVSSLPRALIGTLGFAIVFGHNALGFIQFAPNELGYSLWTILHDRGYLLVTEHFKIKASYPVLPWIGVIFIGYFIGPLFSSAVSAIQRKKWLFIGGLASLSILLVLRGFNLYGETLPWQIEVDIIDSIKSFVNYTKYPPSLDFLLLTLGIALLLLARLDGVHNCLTRVLSGFGSAPLFFYILHLYVLLISYRVLVALYGTTQGAYWGVDNVWQVWMVAALLAALLYLPTRRFARFKQRTRLTWVKYL